MLLRAILFRFFNIMENLIKDESRIELFLTIYCLPKNLHCNDRQNIYFYEGGLICPEKNSQWMVTRLQHT